MKVVGLMSGTSLDGMDVCLLEVEGDDPRELEWTLRAFRSHPYTVADRALLREAMEEGSASLLCRVHGLLAEGMARVVLGLLEGAGVPPDEVAAIGSHGQTFWHQPPRGSAGPGNGGGGDLDRPGDLLQGPRERGYTFQLGDPATLAERTGIDVIHDFRSRDVATGGHGAPLVPWADRVLLSRPGRARVLQNLGGMANLAWIPPRGSPEPLMAFDTGPGVALLDAAVELATGGRRSYDLDGSMARQGRVDHRLLERLLADPFYREPPPRSTGREHFGPHLVAELARERGLETGREGEGWLDFLATLTALTARSVAGAIRTWVPPRPIHEVVLAGGGASNPALVEALVPLLHPIPVLTGADALGIDPDAKEAAAFALLAWAHLKGFAGNVPEVTGGHSRVLGSFTPGRRAAGRGGSRP